MNRKRSDWAFIAFVLLFAVGAGIVLGMCAPVWPATPYVPGGPAVRVYDGGTGAHDAATARRNLGISTGNIPGLRDTLSTLSYVALLNPLVRVLDSQLWIKNVSDTTKKAQFSAASIPTGTTRTYTFPAISGTFMLTGDLLTPGIAHYDGLFRIKDGDLFLKNSSDTTKKTQLTVGSATATTRTLTLPDTTGTLAALNKTQTFTKAQTFAPASDVAAIQITSPAGAVDNTFVVYSTDAGAIMSYIDPNGANVAPVFALKQAGGTFGFTIQPKAAPAANRVYSVDGSLANTDFMMTGGAQTAAGAKTLSGACIISGASTITGATAANVDGTVSHWRLRDQSDLTKQVAANLSQVTTSTTRIDTIPDYSGQRVVRINARDFVTQTANIGSTTICTSPVAGNYRVSIYGVVTGILGGAVTVTIGWTDPQQAQTATSTFGLGVGSYITLDTPVRVASGNITLSSTGYVTGTYSVYARVEALP